MVVIRLVVIQISKNSEQEIELLRYAFRFLKALSRGNPDVQQRLYDRLEFLLAIRCAESELGETIGEVFKCNIFGSNFEHFNFILFQVFKGNLTNCLKVPPAHIKTIARYYAQSFHPVWISVLCCLVVEDIFPLKRNQNFVVKALMTYQQSLSLINDTDTAQKTRILKRQESSERGVSQKHQLCSVVSC